ncbi:MAG: ADP-ribosylglycohydrolase family protein [Gammaproteobacteria bacterium]|nr:ADP-ribosylglycohydrolase family protein [Gammaproteobacteria bacterium]
MSTLTATPFEKRIRNAWSGRISGCQLGKPVERLSMRDGYSELQTYLSQTAALPLRDYIPWSEHPLVQKECCREFLQRSEPDDDINYSVLALMMLEEKGLHLATIDVARFWLRWLPAASTFTAERAAYRTLMQHGAEWFAEGARPGFDLAICSDNRYNDWIGAQIRTDVYGWVLPGNPLRAAELARQDAALSHRGDGVYGAVFIAALGAALADRTPEAALQVALGFLPVDSGAAQAVRLGFSLAGQNDGGAVIRETYKDLSPVHTLNNLAIVVWALYSHLHDFGAAIGDAVAAGLDTDCNGATVGGLWGLLGDSIPARWTAPWQCRVGVSLAGMSELNLDSLIGRTIAVAEQLRGR